MSRNSKYKSFVVVFSDGTCSTEELIWVNDYSVSMSHENQSRKA